MKEITLRNGDVQVLVNEDTSKLVALESLKVGDSFIPPEGMYKRTRPKTAAECNHRYFKAVGCFLIVNKDAFWETHRHVLDTYHYGREYEYFPKDMLVLPYQEKGGS